MHRWIVAVAVMLSSPVAAAPKPGTLLESKPLAWPRYVDIGPIAKAMIAEPAYQALQADRSHELSRVVYASGGQRVVAIACKPKDATPKAPRPLLLWLHGGAGDSAKIGAQNFDGVLQIRRFCAAGFVVLAPQYRGVDGGEGRDEVGGRDVDDVLALLPLARGLDHVDTRRVFAWGFSRGAMMALQLIRERAPITAVVAVGVAADFEYGLRMLPDFAREVPDEGKTPAGIERRSPLRWADKLTNVPILFLHGAEDGAAPAADATALVGKLLAAKGLAELHVYAKQRHPISGKLDEVFQRSLDWFQDVRKRSIVDLFDDTLRKSSAKAATDRMRALRKSEPDRWDFSERELNQLGYTYLFGREPGNAVVVFELSVELYPRSANAWDSLGEGYEAAGRRNDAARAYGKSLAIDPGNAHAKHQLEQLKR